MSNAAGPRHALATVSTGEARGVVARHIEQLLQASSEWQPAGTSDLGVTRDVVMAVLDGLASPVVLCDRQLRVIFANAAARTALCSSCAIWLSSDKLATKGAGMLKLGPAVCSAIHGTTASSSFVIENAGELPTAVWVQPVSEILSTSAPLWAQGLAVVTFKAPPSSAAPSPVLLVKHFRLTVQEAELVGQLVDGASLEEAAFTVGAAPRTADELLLSCCAKTRTTCRRELVRLASTLVPPILE